MLRLKLERINKKNCLKKNYYLLNKISEKLPNFTSTKHLMTSLSLISMKITKVLNKNK